ncbi:hypothetical protein [Paenibacillus lutrae]|uniref:Uncharacterized protein n=1 Tax=Paenibacillus lutrae TaxID=2078573 RepID=A0A7X3FIS6_9BACL|nr:hypothetical protein [Paenibacillus lutrae]MVP00342.1 hypothetical protein [Paenibacillus lutrae]
MAYQYRKPVDDDVPYEQRLINYSQNKDGGKTEYQRAMEVFNAASSLGDTDRAAGAKKWMGQIDVATGGYASKTNDFTAERNNALQQWVDIARQKPTQVTAPKPFSYDQNTDPYYQNALRQARTNIATEQNNTMAKLRGSGQGNSSLSETLSHQIANKQMERVDTQILPQLIDQAYTRNQDQNKWDFDINKENYNRDNEYKSALASVLSTYNNLGQQEFQNNIAESALTGKYGGENTMDTRVKNMDMLFNFMDRTGNIGTPVDDWMNLGRQPSLGRTMQGQAQDHNQKITTSALTGYLDNLPTLEREKFAENVKQFGVEAAMRQLEMAANDSYRASQLGLSMDGLVLDREKFSWSKDVNNPDNQFRLAQLDELKNKGQQQITAEDYASYLDKAVTKDDEGNVITPKEQLELMILGGGLSDKENAKLFARYKLDMTEEQKRLLDTPGN